MTVTDRIKQCRTPQEALLVLAEAIDALQQPAPDPWLIPLTWEGEQPLLDDLPTTPDNRARIEGGDVIVAPVSEERQANRASFAAICRLHEFYGDSLSFDDFIDAYVKGGPRWLYYTDRDVVMQMPRDIRQQLVADVLLDSPSEADEIGRDILKIDESTDEGTQIDWQRAARDLGPLG